MGSQAQPGAASGIPGDWPLEVIDPIIPNQSSKNPEPILRVGIKLDLS